MPRNYGVQQTLVHIEHQLAAVRPQAAHAIVQGMNGTAQPIKRDQMLVAGCVGEQSPR